MTQRTDEIVLQVTGLTKVYPKTGAPALAALDLSVNGGEIFGQVVERWAQSDPDALRRFSATLEDAALREVVDEQLRQRGALPNGGEGAP